MPQSPLVVGVAVPRVGGLGPCQPPPRVDNAVAAMATAEWICFVLCLSWQRQAADLLAPLRASSLSRPAGARRLVETFILFEPTEGARNKNERVSDSPCFVQLLTALPKKHAEN